MTTQHVHKHDVPWWDEIDQLEVDVQNIRGMARVMRRGFVAARDDIRTGRGNKKIPKH